MKNKKVIISIVLIIVFLGMVVGGVFLGFFIDEKVMQNKFDFGTYEYGTKGDRIHFLNTASSDAILLESNGLFAMVDGGEDTDNPRGFKELELLGHEQAVLSYIKRVAGDINGKVNLEFVLGTHSHSDHIGGFDTIILDRDITVKKAFLKQYNEEVISKYEIDSWDNKEVYTQMVQACNARNVPIISDISEEPFKLGNFDISIKNTKDVLNGSNLGENENSLGVLVSKGGVRAFLAGDINNVDGDEDRLAAELGKVDLLKLGHHGYRGSTSKNFIKTLNPAIAIATNSFKGVDYGIKRSVTALNIPIYGTVDHNGIIVDFTARGLALLHNK